MEVFTSNIFIRNMVISIIFLIVLLILKTYLYKTLEKNNSSILSKKKISQSLRSIFVIFLIFIWLYQYKDALFSMVAVAAAIVIALKEIIMCFTGGVLIAISNSFNIGDRITIGEVGGFVIKKAFFSTKILKIGPEEGSQQTTGDVLTIPNSIFLSNAVQNESYFGGLTVRTFKFLISDITRLKEIEKGMLDYSKKLVAPYLDEAKDVITRFCRKEKISVPSLDARTKVSLNEDKLYLLIKIPVKSDSVASIEQQLNRKFTEYLISKS